MFVLGFCTCGHTWAWWRLSHLGVSLPTPACLCHHLPLLSFACCTPPGTLPPAWPQNFLHASTTTLSAHAHTPLPAALHYTHASCTPVSSSPLLSSLLPGLYRISLKIHGRQKIHGLGLDRDIHMTCTLFLLCSSSSYLSVCFAFSLPYFACLHIHYLTFSF